jgi:hypothetical protein
MSKGNNNNAKIKIMEQKELVGKRVLVRLGALPREMQEQRVTEPIFDRISIGEVVGYVPSNTRQVIIKAKYLGWKNSALRDTDIITKKVEMYWLVSLDRIVTVLK